MSTNYIRPDLYPYPSRRSEVVAENMVASSQPLAVAAGLRMLHNGGNAMDAALACAITLTVVEPASNCIGGDGFTLVYDNGQLHGFNGSGKAPAAWTPERYHGLDEMPSLGWDAVTVPGVVDMWVQLSKRFGRLGFAEVCQPAIDYARDGFGVSPVVHRQWTTNEPKLSGFDGFRQNFLPTGGSPALGSRFINEDQASTLQDIAETEGESIYRGRLAELIVADSQRLNGVMSLEDLASHCGRFVDPISNNYKDLTISEIPPNGQGIGALIALGILDRLPLDDLDPDSAECLHLQIEATRIALRQLALHVSDPATMRISVESLLDPSQLDSWAAEIDPDQAADVNLTMQQDRGTVYLCTADRDGMMVSLIQSSFDPFGSGIVVPGTGINMQNRGKAFSLVEGHPNQVDGGKYPFHTIIPGFLSRGDEPLGPFGIMGAHMQAQAHVQFVVRIATYGQSAQAALDAPRFFINPEFNLVLEDGISAEVARQLAHRGHRLTTDQSWGIFGGGQAIIRDQGLYRGASDPRKDGLAMGF